MSFHLPDYKGLTHKIPEATPDISCPLFKQTDALVLLYEQVLSAFWSNFSFSRLLQFSKSDRTTKLFLPKLHFFNITFEEFQSTDPHINSHRQLLHDP